MTTPLWCLLGFVAWTLALLLGVGFSRVGAVLRGEKKANEFPSGVPHGGDAYWRWLERALGAVASDTAEHAVGTGQPADPPRP